MIREKCPDAGADLNRPSPLATNILDMGSVSV
ncbi:hypothetical protein ACVW1A_007103 [Bradyrhizobium sp. LB1.3]